MSSTKDQKNSQIIKRMFSNAAIYGFGMILVKAGYLLLIPFYWKKLSPADFGVIALYQLVVQFLGPIYDFGFSTAVQRHFFEWKKERRPQHIAAAWSVSFSWCLILSLILSAFWSPLQDLVFKESLAFPLLLIAVWGAFFQSFEALPMSLFRIREQAKAFSILETCQFIFQSGLTLYLIFEKDMKAEGFIWAHFATLVFFGILYQLYMFKQATFPWKKSDLKDIIEFAIPTFPSLFFDGFAGVLDRFFLEKFVDRSALGIYSLAQQIAGAYRMFLTMLKSAWVPLTYRLVAERVDAAKVLGRVSLYYVLVILLPALCVALLSKDLIYFFNQSAYFPVADLIPYFILGYFFQGCGLVFGRGLDLAKKMQYNWLIYLVYGATNLVLLWLLTPKYGVWGAVSAFVLSIFARDFFQSVMAFYFYPRRFETWDYFKILISGFATVALCKFFDDNSTDTQVLLKFAIILVGYFLCLIWVLGFKGLKNKFSDLINGRTAKL